MRYEKDGFVSVWLGDIESEKAFCAYIADMREEGGDDETPMSLFAADFGIIAYDPELQEAGFKREALPVDKLIERVPYAPSFMAKAVEAAERCGTSSANAFVLVYDFAYWASENVKTSTFLQFIGAFSYKKPA